LYFYSPPPFSILLRGIIEFARKEEEGCPRLMLPYEYKMDGIINSFLFHRSARCYEMRLFAAGDEFGWRKRIENEEEIHPSSTVRTCVF
jgi:hypothetical protein